jgi:SWI/SNF-related matrix-associated actin-dependent regulator of chromatin subfamily A protein 2/4
MGLGKTVQVMALLAHLMEAKGNYGPHLIIVPNAVLVNWRAELNAWFPSARVVYYVGRREERAALFARDVAREQFNILVTTYEFIMRDRAKLSKVAWKYLVIDEAQRMKDRESKLARDLNHFQCARRLLLTGTPLQNELRELWSLLNLLLPDVFDNKGEFAAWFVDSLGAPPPPGPGGADGDGAADYALERRVVVINRLHQVGWGGGVGRWGEGGRARARAFPSLLTPPPPPLPQILEPFMLRRQVADVEAALPPKVAFTLKCGMPPAQAAAYRWVAATGTLRLDPDAPRRPGTALRAYAPLNNKAMELRKICNHPALSYPPEWQPPAADLVRACGKLAALDRVLVKLHAAGHRVLLFSTMTRLLDLLEIYLRGRLVGPAGGPQAPMGYLRIDGATPLEDREVAIKEFNAPNSTAFLFLLSIRAAGRGLNLQTADTVVVYDPDPNPKNEEQAIARSHRIGQKKEVRVLHLEAVVDAGWAPVSTDGATGAGARAGGGYADTVESIVRNVIQTAKQAMAAEVVDAGRFDQRTSNEDRRSTLEALVADTARAGVAANDVPTHAAVNAMLARTPEEEALFNRLDAELDWPDAGPPPEVPGFLSYSVADAEEAAAVQANPFAAPEAAPAARARPAYREPGEEEFLASDDGDEGKGGGAAGLPARSTRRRASTASARPSPSPSAGPSATAASDAYETEEEKVSEDNLVSRGGSASASASPSPSPAPAPAGGRARKRSRG